MQRILVLGCGGAGKTEFSKRLGQVLDLPIIHLDQHYWNAGWVASDENAWRTRLASLLSGARWILDGNYASTLEIRLKAADSVIFLDYSTLVCVVGALRRILATRGKIRSDCAVGCPERYDTEFFRYIINYRRLHRIRTLEALRAFKGTIVTLRSRREADRLLATASEGGCLKVSGWNPIFRA